MMDEPDSSFSQNKRHFWRDQEVDEREKNNQRTKPDYQAKEVQVARCEGYVARQMQNDNINTRNGDCTETQYISDLMKKEPQEREVCSNDNQEKKHSSNSHVNSKLPEKLYKCDQCDSVFNQKCNLKRHQKLHSGYKPFTCKECGLSFYGHDSLKKHMRTHTGEKPYKCEECDAAFAHSGHLKTHKRIHSGEKPYVCQECGLSFSQAGNLKVHIRVHTGEKPYVCKVCGVAFSISSVFKKHKMIHTGQRPFKCTHCDARFSSNSNLARHNKIHTGEKPFKCKVCSAAFPVKNSLDRHIKSHTGERPYCCEMCGAVFADMSDLTKHRKTHSGDKPFKCDICGLGFYSKSQMKIHNRTHTGEKPHKCLLCGVSFAQIGTLNKHKRTHTGEKPFRCDECGTSFTAKSSLKKHLEKHSYSISSLDLNTDDISGLRSVEPQSASFYGIENKMMSDSALSCQDTLSVSSRVLGVGSFAPASVDIEGLSLSTNVDILHPKHVTLVGNGTSASSLPPSLPDGRSLLMPLDIETPTSVSQPTSLGDRLPVYSSLDTQESSVSEPVSVALNNPANCAIRSVPPVSFPEILNNREFCDLEKSSPDVNYSPPVSATLHYLQSLPVVTGDSNVESDLIDGNTLPRLSPVQKWSIFKE